MSVGQILNVSIGKVKKGISPHKMSLLVDVQMGRPFEVEVCETHLLLPRLLYP